MKSKYINNNNNNDFILRGGSVGQITNDRVVLEIGQNFIYVDYRFS